MNIGIDIDDAVFEFIRPTKLDSGKIPELEKR